jgi:hypothetical protein
MKTVKQIAEELGIKPFQVIHDLMEWNVFASLNQEVDEKWETKLHEKHVHSSYIPPLPTEPILAVSKPILPTISKIKKRNRGDDSAPPCLSKTNPKKPRPTPAHSKIRNVLATGTIYNVTLKVKGTCHE